MKTVFIEELCDKISLPEKAKELAFNELNNNSDEVMKIANNSSLENIRPFLSVIKKDRQKGAALCLAASLVVCEKAYRQYSEKQIPDSVFYDTMSDITVWVNTAAAEENICGLLEMSWLRHSLYLNLFKIGRLQYQFYKTDYFPSGLHIKDIKSAPIKNGSPVLNIHIPQGGKLKLDDCRSSVECARQFFERFYPEYHYDGFVCDSWLLDVNNKAFMNENSNIIHFADLFDKVVPSRFHNKEIMRRLWGTETGNRKIIRTFSEETDLQRRAKKYILSGNKTGNGYGFIIK